MRLSALHPVMRNETEGEVITRSIRSVHFTLTHETGLRHEARHGHRVRLAVGHLQTTEHRTYIRKHISRYLLRRSFIRVAGRHGDGGFSAIRFRYDAYFCVTGRLEVHRYTLTCGVGYRYGQRLAIEAVSYFDRFPFLQRYRLGVGLGFEGPSSGSTAIALGDHLPVFRLTVPGLEVDTSVYLPTLQRADGVTAVDTIRRRSSTCPVVIRIVRTVSRQGVKPRDTVKRYVPGSREDLLIGVRRTEFSQRALDRISPRLILVMVELLVKIAAVQNLRRVQTFIDDGIHRALETELHVLGQVVFDIDMTIPGEVLAVSQVHRLCTRAGQVTQFHVTERTVHIGVERPGLRQIVEIHLLEELHFAHFLHFRERFPRLGVEVISVLETTLMVRRDIPLQFRRVLRLLVIRSRDTEVRRIVEHILFLRVDIDLHVTYAERGGLMHGVGHLFNGVSFGFGIIGIQGLG